MPPPHLRVVGLKVPKGVKQGTFVFMSPAAMEAKAQELSGAMNALHNQASGPGVRRRSDVSAALVNDVFNMRAGYRAWLTGRLLGRQSDADAIHRYARRYAALRKRLIDELAFGKEAVVAKPVATSTRVSFAAALDSSLRDMVTGYAIGAGLVFTAYMIYRSR